MQTLLVLWVVAIIAVGVLGFTKLISRLKKSVAVRNAKEIKTTVGTELGFQAVKIPGRESDPKQLVVRRANWNDKKELTERQEVENLCKFTERQSWTLEAREQNDSVDITARSPDGKSQEDFQIVRLWEQAVWQQLSTKHAADRCYTDQEVIDLFRKLLQTKGVNKYPPDVRKELTLLIDGNPIVNMSAFLTGLESAVAPLARQLGYRSVWVVGTADAHRLV